jgi:hypothetical protein
MKAYIDKDAVMAEIERRRDLHYKYYMKNGVGSIAECKYDEDREILSFLDTLEVKEVDFERDLSKYVSNGIHRFFPSVNDDYCKMDSVVWQDYVIETAKYFFELGLKAKGE